MINHIGFNVFKEYDGFRKKNEFFQIIAIHEFMFN